MKIKKGDICRIVSDDNFQTEGLDYSLLDTLRKEARSLIRKGMLCIVIDTYGANGVICVNFITNNSVLKSYNKSNPYMLPEDLELINPKLIKYLYEN